MYQGFCDFCKQQKSISHDVYCDLKIKNHCVCYCGKFVKRTSHSIHLKKCEKMQTLNTLEQSSIPLATILQGNNISPPSPDLDISCERTQCPFCFTMICEADTQLTQVQVAVKDHVLSCRKKPNDLTTQIETITRVERAISASFIAPSSSSSAAPAPYNPRFFIEEKHIHSPVQPSSSHMHLKLVRSIIAQVQRYVTCIVLGPTCYNLKAILALLLQQDQFNNTAPITLTFQYSELSEPSGYYYCIHNITIPTTQAYYINGSSQTLVDIHSIATSDQVSENKPMYLIKYTETNPEALIDGGLIIRKTLLQYAIVTYSQNKSRDIGLMFNIQEQRVSTLIYIKETIDNCNIVYLLDINQRAIYVLGASEFSPFPLNGIEITHNIPKNWSQHFLLVSMVPK